MSEIKKRKRKNEKRRRKRKILVIACGTILVIGMLALILNITTTHKSQPSSTDTSKKAQDSNTDTKETTDGASTENTVNEPIQITVSSIGDCTLGTDEYFDQSVSLNAYYNLYGADYFFQNVRPVLEEDDLSIVNMEGTLTTSTDRQDKTFAFKGSAEYSKILSGSSVEAANLANNHSRDYGEQSYTDTINTLENDGITTFGNESVKIMDIKGIKVGLTGIFELNDHLGKGQEVKENIAALKEQGAQLIIVNFHWGIEKDYLPDDNQKQLAHLAINEGADLVIGHHPHVLQGIEKYNGKYIAYSLGNFCFGGNSNPKDKDTMIFQQTFTITKDGVEENDDINIIPCSLSSSSDHNDYCPVILEGEEKQRVLDKIEEYSQDL